MFETHKYLLLCSIVSFFLLVPTVVHGQSITVDVPKRAARQSGGGTVQPIAKVELVLQLDQNPDPAAVEVQRRSGGSPTGSKKSTSNSGYLDVDGDLVAYEEAGGANQIRLTFTPDNNFSSSTNYCRSNFDRLSTDGYQVTLSNLSNASITDYSVTTYTIASTDACSCRVRRTKTPPIASASSSAFSGVSKVRSPIDVALVIDKSGSMGWQAPGTGMTRKELLSSALSSFIDAWKMESTNTDRLGLTFFSDNEQVPSALSNNFFVRPGTTQPNWMTIKDEIKSYVPGGGTSMGDGLIEAYQQMSDFTGGQVVLVTDGMQNEPEEVKTCGALNKPPGCTNASDSDYALLDPSNSQQIPLKSRCRIIHPVGIGLTGTKYSSLLDDIATQTGGNSGVTSSQNTATAIANTLVDVLKGNTLDKVLQESGTVTAQQSSVSPGRFLLNRTAGQVIAMLNWTGSGNADALDIRFIGPNGQERSPTETERGDYHTVKSIEFEEEANPGEWEVQVVRRSGSEGDVDYQLTVLADEYLFSHEVAFATPHTFTGEPITLQLALAEGGEPLTDIDPSQIEVEVSRPQVGFGSYLSDQRVPDEVYEKRPGTNENDEPVSRWLRKLEYLRREGALQEVTALERVEAPSFRAGSSEIEDGILLGSDGIYTMRFKKTQKPGKYEFRIRFQVETERGGTVSRVMDVQRMVEVFPNLAESNVRARVQEGSLKVRMTPTDNFGNLLGPGYGSNLGITSSGDEEALQPSVRGNGRGTYVITIPDINPDNSPRLTFQLSGRSYHSVTTTQLLEGEIPKERNLSVGGGGGCSLIGSSNESDKASLPGLIVLLVLVVAGRAAYRSIDSRV